jgi:hypothetical protein
MLPSPLRDRLQLAVGKTLPVSGNCFPFPFHGTFLGAAPFRTGLVLFEIADGPFCLPDQLPLPPLASA